MGETFNVYETGLDHEEIESKIIGLEKDYTNFDIPDSIRDSIKKNLLDSIKHLPLDKQKNYKTEFQNKALNANGKLKGLYYELAAGVINGIDSSKNVSKQSEKNIYIQENREILNEIDFSIQNATAKIKHLGSGAKEYILNQRYSPEIIKLGNNLYEITLIMKRNSRSSLRGDEKVVLNFSYDGHRLLFFNDKNNNGNLDNHEGGKLIRVDHKNETKIDRNQGVIYHRGSTEKINLNKHSITENGVRNIELELYFK